MASVTDGLQRRLLPLQGATFAGGFVLWYGVEKLFMTQLGFDARSIGLFAAAYAAMVPLMDVGFGVLADRWSRKGVLMLGYAALVASSLAGALSLVPVAVGFGAMTDPWGVGTAAWLLVTLLAGASAFALRAVRAGTSRSNRPGLRSHTDPDTTLQPTGR